MTWQVSPWQASLQAAFVSIWGAEGSPIPSLDLNFTSGSLDPRITFSRGSLATLTNAAGNVAYAPHNLFANSADFSQASWVKGGASVSGTGALVEDGTTGVHRIYQSASTSASPSMCVRAMAGTRSWMMLQDIGGAKKCWFDLVNGVVGTKSSGVTGTITAVGGGYYDCTITIDATSSIYLIEAASADNSTTYTGVNGNTAITLARAQLNLGPLQPYYPTTSAAYHGPRFTFDPITHASLGLLIEEQRTNLLLQSGDLSNAAWGKAAGTETVVANAAVSPDGGTNAASVARSGTTWWHGVRESAVVSSSTVYTASMRVKAGTGAPGMLLAGGAVIDCGVYVLAGVSTVISDTGTSHIISHKATNLGNGWYQLEITINTSTQTSLSVGTADGSAVSGALNYYWGAQLEAGSFATSYIPTTSATVTRAADSATMTGTNFSSWFNASQGTFVVEWKTAKTSRAIIISDGSFSNYLEVLRLNTFSAGAYVGPSTGDSVVGAGAYASGQFAAGESLKSAVSYSATALIAAQRGSSTTAAAPTFTGINSLRMGVDSPNVTAVVGSHTISRLRYYPTALTNAQLQALTT